MYRGKRGASTGKLGKSLLAIVVGNLIYFWALPRLPYSWRHRAYAFDFGLVVDFFCCVVVYILLDAILHSRERGG